LETRKTKNIIVTLTDEVVLFGTSSHCCGQIILILFSKYLREFLLVENKEIGPSRVIKNWKRVKYNKKIYTADKIKKMA
jgi:hypothetical protein